MARDVRYQVFTLLCGHRALVEANSKVVDVLIPLLEDNFGDVSPKDAEHNRQQAEQCEATGRPGVFVARYVWNGVSVYAFRDDRTRQVTICGQATFEAVDELSDIYVAADNN